MKIMVVGDDHAAWTMASVLASTGCHCVICKETIAPVDINEPGLNRLSSDQIRLGRLQLLPQQAPVADADLVIYAEPQANYEQLLTFSLEFALSAQENITATQAVNSEHAQEPSPEPDNLSQPDSLPQSDSLARPDNLSKPNQTRHRVIALIHPLEIGSTDRLQQDLLSRGYDFISVVFWPSFIQSGRAIDSFSYPDRVLLGSNNAKATEMVRQIMSPYNRRRDNFMLMAPKEAELTKVAVNGMLATRISFMNELAEYASLQGIDIEPVRQGIGSDSRIGFQYLYPGCGFGGQAFLDTLYQLTRELESHQQSQQASGLLHSVWQRNEQQKDLLFQKFWRFYQADIQDKTVAIWGGAFKPNTASIAGSPAIDLIEALLAHGVQVRLYDPAANQALIEFFSGNKGIMACSSAYQAVEGSDALMLVTEWKEFWNLDLLQIAGKMRTPLLLDGRNIYDPEYAQQSGLTYSGIGRGERI